MIKIYQKQPIQAEQFDGSQKMVDKYHISVYNENIDKYGGLGDWTPNEYTFNGTYIDVGDWIIENSENIHPIMTNNVFKKDYAELPVIPKAVADWIEECKQKHISIGDMLCSERRPEKMRDWMALTPGTYQFDYVRYQKYQELVARAWLDGYQVEEDE